MNKLTDESSSGKKWKKISIGLGVGFIFATGCLVGEHLNNLFPNNSLDNMMLPNKESQLSKLAVAGMKNNAIAEIASNVAPCVVNIDLQTNSVPPAVKGNSAFPFFNGPEITSSDENPRSQVGRSMGTGVIMRSDGYILTSGHVVRSGCTITVGLSDNRKFPAEIIGKDRFSDLAVIKIKAEKLPVPRFGSAKDLRPGDWAIAIGSPLGFDHSVSLGIISALGRAINDNTFHNRIELIQTDAAINPGSSGGPLLNINGEVIGINTAIRADAQGIGFSIPVDEARKVAMQLIAHGDIPRPYLGVHMRDVDPYLAQLFKIPNTVKGVIVAQVVEAGPFEKAGLAAGDVLQMVEGQSVINAADVRKIIRDKKPGDTLDVTFWRKGALQNRKIEIGKYPSD